MIKATRVHCGQYKRYGDFFRVWDIETDENEETVRDYCFTELYKTNHEMPTKAQWHFAVRFDGEHHNDPSYYFRGYYELEKTETGYKFTVCEPFAD